MANVGMETGFEWSGMILLICLLIGGWQLLGHIERYCENCLFGKSSRQKNAEQKKQGNGPGQEAGVSAAVWLTPYVKPFFAYALTTIIFLAIVVCVFGRYQVFGSSAWNFDGYLEDIVDMCFLQALVLIMAWLLRVYSEQEMHRLIPGVFVVMGLDVVFETALQFYQYPVYHWVQFLDIWLTGMLLLVIPVFGFMGFRFLNHRAKNLPEQL